MSERERTPGVTTLQRHEFELLMRAIGIPWPSGVDTTSTRAFGVPMHLFVTQTLPGHEPTGIPFPSAHSFLSSFSFYEA